MSEEMPVWRQAIANDQHPLHRAAWMLFSKDFDVARAVTRLEDQKDDVIGFCMLLLDSPELYPSSALGSGGAPVHAVQLLCKWKVESALPRLLKIMEEENWDTIIYGTTADYIEAFGADVIEPLLEMATRRTGDQEQVAIAGTLADAAPGDPRTVAFVRKIFTSREQDFEILYMSENVLVADPEGGVKWLENRMRTHKYDKNVRQKMEQNIANYKAGKF